MRQTLCNPASAHVAVSLAEDTATVYMPLHFTTKPSPEYVIVETGQLHALFL